MNRNILLIIAAVLVVYGLAKPKLNNIIPNPVQPVVVEVIDAPSDPKLKDAEPRTSFVILIDDTIEEEIVTPAPKRTRRTKIEEDLEVTEDETFTVADTVADSFSGFINL